MTIREVFLGNTLFREDSPKTFTYTKTNHADLKIVVHILPGWKVSDKRP